MNALLSNDSFFILPGDCFAAHVNEKYPGKENIKYTQPRFLSSEIKSPLSSAE